MADFRTKLTELAQSAPDPQTSAELEAVVRSLDARDSEANAAPGDSGGGGHTDPDKPTK